MRMRMDEHNVACIREFYRRHEKFINSCSSCRQRLENEEKRYEICPRLEELDNNASASRRVLPDTSFDDDDDDEETDYESSDDDDDDDEDVSDWVTSVVFSPDGQYLARALVTIL